MLSCRLYTSLDSVSRGVDDGYFLISAGEITKAARSWLVGQLDTGQRRHIIFMDREELLDQSARILLYARIDEPIAISDDDVPF
jgi:hypothetical protein